jgi:hypothetical protein
VRRALQWLANLFGVSKLTLVVVLLLALAFAYLQEIHDFTEEIIHAIHTPHP